MRPGVKRQNSHWLDRAVPKRASVTRLVKNVSPLNKSRSIESEGADQPSSESCRGRAAAIVNHHKFDQIILTSIGLNAVFMVTLATTPELKFAFGIINFIFNVIFLVRLMAQC